MLFEGFVVCSSVSWLREFGLGRVADPGGTTKGQRWAETEEIVEGGEKVALNNDTYFFHYEIDRIFRVRYIKSLIFTRYGEEDENEKKTKREE